MTLIIDSMTSTPKSASSITDVTAETLGHAVIDASIEQLVLLQFWRPSHIPSRTLSTLLSTLQSAYKGSFKITRISIDQSPEVAQAMGITTLPTVVAFMKGRPVDAFTGSPSEPDIKKFIERFIQQKTDPLEDLLTQAHDALQAGHMEEAHAFFIQILSTAPTHAEALLGLARCAMEMGSIEKAEAILMSLPQEVHKKASYLGLLDGLEVFKRADTEFPSRDNDPYNEALFALKKRSAEDAFEALLDGIKIDQNDTLHPNRALMLKLFNYYGPTHPLTITNRKALSKILFS